MTNYMILIEQIIRRAEKQLGLLDNPKISIYDGVEVGMCPFVDGWQVWLQRESNLEEDQGEDPDDWVESEFIPYDDRMSNHEVDIWGIVTGATLPEALQKLLDRLD